MDFFLTEAGATGEEVTQVEVSQVVASPHQPRREFSVAELEALARSIRATGMLQPILVRKSGEGRMEIVAGERRWRAAKMIGLERIPAIVRDVTGEQAAVFGLVENIHRADLNAIEKAKALRRIQKMTGATQEDLARQVGLERPSVANLLRLLDLPEAVQAHVSRGTLTMGHARALLGLASAEEQETAAEQVIRGKLSVRQVEALVQSLQGQPASPRSPSPSGSSRVPAERPLWLNEIEETLVDALGTPVHVRYGKKRSRIVIECLGREDFERVYEKLKSLGEV